MFINLKNQKGISLLKLILIIVIIIIAIGFISSFTKQPGYKLDKSNGEAVAYTRLRLSIANARVADNLSSTLSKEDFDKLEEIVENADSSYNWFADSSSKIFIFANYATDDVLVDYGIPAEDVDEFEITWVSDGTYCAVFTMRKVDTDYYLVDYDFSADDTVGCMLTLD